MCSTRQMTQADAPSIINYGYHKILILCVSPYHQRMAFHRLPSAACSCCSPCCCQLEDLLKWAVRVILFLPAVCVSPWCFVGETEWSRQLQSFFCQWSPEDSASGALSSAGYLGWKSVAGKVIAPFWERSVRKRVCDYLDGYGQGPPFFCLMHGTALMFISFSSISGYCCSLWFYNSTILQVHALDVYIQQSV